VGQAKVDQESVKHAESSLATAHQAASAQRAINQALTVDTKYLRIAGARA
jgi:hypothetical protein